MEAKYIIIDNVKPVIFSKAIEHIDEANGRNVTSAGFCEIFSYNGRVAVSQHGRSESLNIGQKPNDAEVIRKVLGG